MIIHTLNLDELKALHAKGGLSRYDLLVQDQWGYTVFHNLAEYNPDSFNIFQWLKDLKWITKDDLFIKHGRSRSTLLHWLARNKDALSIFPWLKDIKWITKDDLFIENNYGNTVLHRFADNEDALSIFPWLKDLEWITRDDLFKKNNDGKTILDFLFIKDRKKVLALFDLELFDKENPKRLQCRLSIDNVVNVKDTNPFNHWGCVDFDSRDFDDGDELEIRIKRSGVLFTVTTIHSDFNEKWKSNVTDTFKMHQLNMAKVEQIEHECQFNQDKNEDD